MNDNGVGDGGIIAALVGHGIGAHHLILATLSIVCGFNRHYKVGEYCTAVLDGGRVAHEGVIQCGKVGERSRQVVGAGHRVVHQHTMDGRCQRIHNTEGILAGSLALITIHN